MDEAGPVDRLFQGGAHRTVESSEGGFQCRCGNPNVGGTHPVEAFSQFDQRLNPAMTYVFTDGSDFLNCGRDVYLSARQ